MGSKYVRGTRGSSTLRSHGDNQLIAGNFAEASLQLAERNVHVTLDRPKLRDLGGRPHVKEEQIFAFFEQLGELFGGKFLSRLRGEHAAHPRQQEKNSASVHICQYSCVTLGTIARRMRFFTFLLVCLPLVAANDVPRTKEIDRAFNRMYNFDFRGSHSLLDDYVAGHPDEPLPYAVRSAAYLFSELDRLGVLESEFFSDDKRIIAKKGLKPDPGVRDHLYQAIEDAQQRAEAVLAREPGDADALFAMCITQGILSDYKALVEKRQLSSLSNVRRAGVYGRRLLAENPQYYDAYLTTGVTEYVLGSLPFFIRWFVRTDGIQASKDRGIEELELVARQGHYLRPFAKILLGIAYLRAERPADAERMLAELLAEFPENPLIRKELMKIRTSVAR